MGVSGLDALEGFELGDLVEELLVVCTEFFILFLLLLIDRLEVGDLHLESLDLGGAGGLSNLLLPLDLEEFFLELVDLLIGVLVLEFEAVKLLVGLELELLSV